MGRTPRPLCKLCSRVASRDELCSEHLAVRIAARLDQLDALDADRAREELARFYNLLGESLSPGASP